MRTSKKQTSRVKRSSSVSRLKKSASRAKRSNASRSKRSTSRAKRSKRSTSRAKRSSASRSKRSTSRAKRSNASRSKRSASRAKRSSASRSKRSASRVKHSNSKKQTKRPVRSKKTKPELSEPEFIGIFGKIPNPNYKKKYHINCSELLFNEKITPHKGTLSDNDRALAKKAWKKWMIQNHPDKFANDPVKFEEKNELFKKVNTCLESNGLK